MLTFESAIFIPTGLEKETLPFLLILELIPADARDEALYFVCPSELSVPEAESPKVNNCS